MITGVINAEFEPIIFDVYEAVRLSLQNPTTPIILPDYRDPFTSDRWNCRNNSDACSDTIGYNGFVLAKQRNSIGYHSNSIGCHSNSIGYHSNSIGYHSNSIGYHTWSLSSDRFLLTCRCQTATRQCRG